jgi:crossover junction endodeoxyribonuclease RuvC
MILAGIDPGVRKCGFAVVELKSLQEFRILDLGFWKLPETESVGFRLERLHESVSAFLKIHNPRWIGLEKAVAFKNVSSALTLSEARGVIRLAVYQTLDQASGRLVELSPTAIKRSATGLGIAGKEDIQKILSFRFPDLKQIIEKSGPLSHDAFDALAIAWTVLSQLRNPTARRLPPEQSL